MTSAPIAGRDAQELLLTFVRQMPVAVAMFDRNMRYLEASDRWCEEYRLKRPQVLGKSHYEISPEIPERWRAFHRRGLAGEVLRSDDELLDRAGGRRTWLRWKIQPWGAKNGLPEGILIFSEDVTARILAETSEAQALARMNDVADGLWRARDLRAGLDLILSAAIDLMKADMGNVQVADVTRPLLHIQAHKNCGDDFLRTFREVAPDDGTPCARAFHDGRRVIVEDIDADGPSAPRREALHSAGVRAIQSTPLIGWGGRVIGILSTHFRTAHRPSEEELRRLDQYARLAAAFIEQNRMEEGLRQSERQLRVALDASAAGVWSVDMPSGQVTWDERSRELFGIPAAGADTLESVMSRIPEEDRIRMLSRLEHMRRTPADDDWNVEFRTLTPDGETRWVHGIGKAQRDSDGALARISGIGLDITKRKQTEDALAQSMREFHDLVENSPDGIARLDPQGRYRFVNPRMAELGRCTEEDFLGKPIGSVAGGGSERWLRLVKNVVETGEVVTAEHVFPDEQLVVSIRLVPERNPDGTTRSLLMIATDMTERRRAEKLAGERATLIETLFDSAAQGIFASDADGKIELINTMAEQMFGYEPGELLHQSHELLLPEQVRQKHARHRESFAAAPKRRPMGQGLDLLARRKDGSLFPVEVSLCYLNAEQGFLAVSFVTDITVRKEQERELKRLSNALYAAEENAAREIAQELHDDITQRLAFLSIEIGKTASEEPMPDSMRPKLKSLQAGIQELSERIRQISHRMHPSVLEDLGLVSALEDLCTEFESVGGLSIAFEASGVPDHLDRSLSSCLYRVCQECLRNISKHAKADAVEVRVSVDGETVSMAIVDTGVGFDPAAIRSGLGTYSMMERVRLVNGTMSIESEPGRGTRVFVRVPLKTEAHGGSSLPSV